MIGGLLRLARPHQWVKNLLVFAAPGTAGVLDDGAALLDVFVVFLAFCAVASGTYCINDILDREQDARHPRKKHRPVASGAVPVTVAAVYGTVLFAVGIGAMAAAGRPAAIAVLVTYVVITLGYSSVLKHVPVVDLVAVASGFLLRAAAGAAAADVPISTFFLIVASFGAIFLVAGKRHAEVVALGEESGLHRRALEAYSRAFLQHVRTVSSSVAVVAYCIWALEQGEGQDIPFFGISIVPFVLALLRYELLIEEGHGGEPDEVFRRNREIQILGALWILLVMAGVYVD